MEELSINTSEYYCDETQLQIIFPEEVWLLVFKQIKDSYDYNRIDAASPYFHQLLLPLRTRILFSEVIKLCIESLLFTVKPYFSLLHCRFACKAWKEGVDAAFHQILSEIGVDAEHWKRFGSPGQILDMKQKCLIYEPNIYNQSKLDRFLEFFHNSHFLTGSNPFPSRSIKIPICSNLTLYNKLFDILQIYGHHIWHCHVELDYENLEQQQEVVLIFQKFLTLLTHLQTLRIYNLDDYWNENTENLKPVLTANPMPKLKNLKFLSCKQTARPIVSELIQKNSHIKGLSLSELDFSNPSALLSTPLPNLEEFHILDFISAKDFSQLQTAHVQWQPTKLTFCLYFNCDEDFKINHVFSWIEAQWSESLKELNIYIPDAVSFSEIDPVKLPNLTTLRIQMEGYVCLDFILPLSKSLVHLSVDHDGEHDEYNNILEKDSKIKFFVHMHNLEKSNIWKFFPRLREIYYADVNALGLFARRVYRRNDWVGYTFEGIKLSKKLGNS